MSFMDALCSTTSTCTVNIGDPPCVRGSPQCYDYNCLYVQKKIVHCTNPTFGGCQEGVICPKNFSTPTPTMTPNTTAPNASTSLPTMAPTVLPTVVPTTTPTGTPAATNADDSTSHTTSIILGTVLGVVLLVALVFWLCARRRRLREEDEDSGVNLSGYRPKQQIVLGSVNRPQPASMESFALDSVASKSMFNTVGRQSNHDLLSQKSDWWQQTNPSFHPTHDTRSESGLQFIAEERRTDPNVRL
ncbi:hypothetical protein ACHHYP_17107 [Achlya hypogyna]|uniref:Uncharacterized protein n=1 Tax=Achlya hypogyna TaxID=1202772 RepID=A0A1V9Y586_ACHHY|nr:hypothetical protein ACHHYP_17107 [Achlya hypogyna]